MNRAKEIFLTIVTLGHYKRACEIDAVIDEANRISERLAAQFRESNNDDIIRAIRHLSKGEVKG